jgi:hypothetical protein
MITICNLTDPSVFQVGTRLRFSQPYVPSDWFWYENKWRWSNDFRSGHISDPLFWGFEFIIPWTAHSAFWLCGYSNPNGEMPMLSICGSKPVTDRDFDPGKDWARNGNVFRALRTLGHPTPPHLNSWFRETDTVHDSGRGLLLAGAGMRTLYPDWTEVSNHGYKFRVRSSGAYDIYRNYREFWYDDSEEAVESLVVHPSTIGADITTPYTFKVMAPDDLAKVFKDHPFIQWEQYDGYAYNRYTYFLQSLDLKWSSAGGVFEMGYEFINQARSLSTWYAPDLNHTSHYRVLIRLESSFTPTVQGSGHALSGLIYPRIVERTDVSRTVTCLHAEGDEPSNYIWEVHPTAREDTGITTLPIGIVSEHVVVHEGMRLSLAKAVKTAAVRMERAQDALAAWVDTNHDQIRPCCLISAGDAIGTYVSDANWLESFPELPSLVKGIKNVAELASALKGLRSGDLRALSRVVDSLANAYLYYKYGASPAKSDYEAARKLISQRLNDLDVLSKGMLPRVYGKFSYKIPEELPGFPGVLRVEARTTMAIRVSPTGWVLQLLAIEDAGLLPSLANIWDLVPFSFILDWFTSLGDRFEDIDRYALRELIDVDYYIHTWKYSYTPSEKIYSPLSIGGNERLQLTRFVRERSLLNPSFSKSRFDFHQPTGLKHRLAAAGSLIWVLGRKS